MTPRRKLALLLTILLGALVTFVWLTRPKDLLIANHSELQLEIAMDGQAIGTVQPKSLTRLPNKADRFSREITIKTAESTVSVAASECVQVGGDLLIAFPPRDRPYREIRF
jgi:hypothetical protein